MKLESQPLSARVQAALAKQRAEGAKPRPILKPYAGRGTRNDFLAYIYANGLVHADAFSAHSSDKLFFAKLLASAAPEAYALFHPRTFSIADLGDAPAIFLGDLEVVAKPAAGMNGSGHLFLSTYEFLAHLKQSPAAFAESEEPSPLTHLLSSGARYIVQEKVKGEEFRLHTFEGRVVAGATFTRWDKAWSRAAFAEAEEALQHFLNLIPDWFLRGQAWGLDFVRTENGYRVIDVNTNRGEARQWSGDLSLPDVLKAYADHLEFYYGADFTQAGGPELKSGRANLEKFIDKNGPEAWARHQSLRAEMRP